MHSKRRYKICVRSDLSLFEITRQGFRVIFPKMLAAIKSFWKVRIFLIPLCIAFSIPNISSFFFYEKKLNLGSDMGKIKLQKIIGNLLDKLRKLYMNGMVI